MIEIVDYNEKWPLKYAAEANDIRNIISSNLVSILSYWLYCNKRIKS